MYVKHFDILSKILIHLRKVCFSSQGSPEEAESSFYLREALKPLEQLRLDFDRLTREHDKFKQEHAAALEKSKLYDTDLGDKYRTIKVYTSLERRKNFICGILRD